MYATAACCFTHEFLKSIDAMFFRSDFYILSGNVKDVFPVLLRCIFVYYWDYTG